MEDGEGEGFLAFLREEPAWWLGPVAGGVVAAALLIAVAEARSAASPFVGPCPHGGWFEDERCACLTFWWSF